MVTATRLLLITMTVASVPLYFVFILPEDLLIQIAGAVVILLLISLILFTGRPSIPNRKKETVEIKEDTVFADVELPPPVISDDSVSQSRESKVRRSRRRSAIQESNLAENLPPLPISDNAVSLENATPPDSSSVESIEGVAKVHVAKVDPELEAEAEVDRYLAQQRERRSIFRDRLHKERRQEMANRLAEKVREWGDIEDGEDLSTLVGIPGHGLAVMYEPENPDPTIPQGITYVRIDDERVLKIRISLDFPQDLDTSIVSGNIPELIGDPPLPSPIDSQMPPLPLPDMPPPVTGKENR